MKDTQARKYQLTINNPLEHGLDHEAIKNLLGQLTALSYYCMADEIGLETGTTHTHIFLMLRSATRFSRIKRLFPTAHIETAHGTAQENRAYVEKSGKWAEDKKSDTSVPGTFEEWGNPDEPGQGNRSDLEEIEAMLHDGKTPSEIMESNFAYRRYKAMIREAYFDKRKRETPVERDVKVHYLVGESGSGKTHTYVDLCETHGEEAVYILTDYEGGGLDNYQGEPILVMDEYKGQFRFSQLLMLLQGYKSQFHARYSNIYMLWTEVYITSVFPPEELYSKMVEESKRARDTQQQLFRRITDITYCFVDAAGEYQRYTIPMSDYVDYAELKNAALEHTGADVPEIEAFEEIPAADSGNLPF